MNELYDKKKKKKFCGPMTSEGEARTVGKGSKWRGVAGQALGLWLKRGNLIHFRLQHHEHEHELWLGSNKKGMNVLVGHERAGFTSSHANLTECSAGEGRNRIIVQHTLPQFHHHNPSSIITIIPGPKDHAMHAGVFRVSGDISISRPSSNILQKRPQVPRHAWLMMKV